MASWLEGIIAAWGPLAVFVGCFIEGETAAILGGIFAHRGLAGWPLMALMAFLGAFLADVMWFALSRHLPDNRLLSRLRDKAKRSGLEARVYRHRALMTFAFRFLPGTRVAGPILMGQSAMPALEFVLINALASAIWALGLTAIGWQFGQAAEGLFGRLAAHHWIILLVLVTATLLAAHVFFQRRRHKRQARLNAAAPNEAVGAAPGQMPQDGHS